MSSLWGKEGLEASQAHLESSSFEIRVEQEGKKRRERIISLPKEPIIEVASRFNALILKATLGKEEGPRKFNLSF